MWPPPTSLVRGFPFLGCEVGPLGAPASPATLRGIKAVMHSHKMLPVGSSVLSSRRLSALFLSKVSWSGRNSPPPWFRLSKRMISDPNAVGALDFHPLVETHCRAEGRAGAQEGQTGACVFVSSHSCGLQHSRAPSSEHLLTVHS